MSGDNGIIKTAKDAGEETRGAGVEEAKDLWKTEEKMKIYTGKEEKPLSKLLEELLKNKQITEEEKQEIEETGKVTIGSRTIVFKESEIAYYLKVGDYINYGEKLEVKEHETKTEETGYTTSQTFQTNKTIAWRVINITQNGEIEIVATENVLTKEGDAGLYLKGKNGFLNAQKVLEELCDNLYSSSYGKARNIKVEDINQLTGYEPSEPEEYTYTTGLEFYDKKINNFRKPTEEEPVVVDATTYTYKIDTQIPLYDTLMANTYHPGGDWNVDSNRPEHYWLSDNAIWCTEERATFGWRDIRAGSIDGSPLITYTTDLGAGEGSYSNGVRVIVKLSKGVSIDRSNNTYDGSSAELAWRLKMD